MEKYQIYKKAQEITSDIDLIHWICTERELVGMNWQLCTVLYGRYVTSMYTAPTTKAVRSQIKAPMYID